MRKKLVNTVSRKKTRTSSAKKSVDTKITFNKDDIKNFVFKRLGEPVVQVEITVEQFDEIYNSVISQIQSLAKNEILACCAETLSLIRGKVDEIPLPGGQTIKLNAKSLVEFANSIRGGRKTFRIDVGNLGEELKKLEDYVLPTRG